MHASSKKNLKMLCVAGASCLCLLSMQKPSQDIPLLKRIRDYWKEGNYTQARHHISSYLEQYPQGTLTENLHLLLGDLYMQEGNFSLAWEEYSLLQDKTLQEQSIYNLSICLYEMKQWEKLFSLTKTLSQYPSLSLSQVQSIRYLCALSLKESQDAALLPDAILLFESCQDTPFHANALSSLISIYLQQGEKEKAAHCYLAMADIQTENSISYLVQAAQLQQENNPDVALQLWQDIAAKDSPFQSQAAYNTCLIQHQLQQYQACSETAQRYHSLFSPQQEASVSFCAGSCLYALGQYENALSYLYPLLENPHADVEAKHEALWMSLSSAYSIQDLSLYQRLWETLQNKNVPKEQISYAHICLIELAYALGQKDIVIDQASSFLSLYDDHAKKSQVQMYLLHGLYQSQQWLKAYEASLSITSSEKTDLEMIALQMNCLSQIIQQDANAIDFRRRWICLAEKYLSSTSSSQEEKREHCLLELCQALIYDEQFTNALYRTDQFLTEFPESLHTEAVELMQTLCYLEDKESPLLFAMQAEKFLEKHPSHAHASKIHLHLFNTYLSLGTDPALQKEMFEKAAAHLHTVFIEQSHDIHKNNLQWLATFYYLSSPDNHQAQLRAISLLEYLLQDSSFLEQKEENIFRLSEVFSRTKEYQKKASLLEEWAAQCSTPQTSLQKHLFFELADTYKNLSQEEKALSLYDMLIMTSSNSQIGALASLERCKILFHKLPASERIEENPACQEILYTLKDLENQRNLSSEPLHIEAGLEYVEYTSSLLPDMTERQQKRKELLTLCQEKLLSAYAEEEITSQKSVIGHYAQFLSLQIQLYGAQTTEEQRSAIQQLHALLDQETTPVLLRRRIQISLE